MVDLGLAPNRAVAAQKGTGEVVQLLASALGVLLLSRGWSVSGLPGDPIVFTKGDQRLAPAQDIIGIARGELTADAWGSAWRAAGLADVELGSVTLDQGVGRPEPTSSSAPEAV
jgi:hypothetical protein